MNKRLDSVTVAGDPRWFSSWEKTASFPRQTPKCDYNQTYKVQKEIKAGGGKQQYQARPDWSRLTIGKTGRRVVAERESSWGISADDRRQRNWLRVVTPPGRRQKATTSCTHVTFRFTGCCSPYRASLSYRH